MPVHEILGTEHIGEVGLAGVIMWKIIKYLHTRLQKREDQVEEMILDALHRIEAAEQATEKKIDHLTDRLTEIGDEFRSEQLWTRDEFKGMRDELRTKYATKAELDTLACTIREALMRIEDKVGGK